MWLWPLIQATIRYKTDFWWWRTKKWTSLKWFYLASLSLWVLAIIVWDPRHIWGHRHRPLSPDLARISSRLLRAMIKHKKIDFIIQSLTGRSFIHLDSLLLKLPIDCMLKSVGSISKCLIFCGRVVCRVWRLVHGWTGIFRLGRFCNISCEIYCNKVVVISDRFFTQHTSHTGKFHASLDPSYFNAWVEGLRHKKSAQIAMNKSFGQFKWNYYLLP